MAEQAKQILIIGAGSVGKRHLGNLHDLGIRRFAVVDPRKDRRDDALTLVPEVTPHATLAEALATTRFDAAVIGSPPSYHVDQAIALIDAGVPFFLEKPVCKTLYEARRLERALQANPVAHVLGYTYRWWPPLRAFRTAMARIGKPLHARFVMSAHLADWHTWERYQDFFMASAEQGGGALLDESHFLDLMCWFFGMPETLYGEVGKISTLEIDTDDNVDCLATYGSGLRVSIHLDLFGRPHEKYISISGEGGTVDWRFDPNEVRFSNTVAGEYEVETFTCERNAMFVEAIREFLAVIDGQAEPSCTLADGIDVMRLIEAVRTSTRDGRVVRMTEL
ncbi:MAG: putative dehydrogenase [Afipia broomeae]|jgi:predicted dehydrogenase